MQPEFILEKAQTGVRIHLQEEHTKELDRWIAERHYLKSAPCGARLRLWIFDQERNLIGAMMWGRPLSRFYDKDKILSLTRMCFIEDITIEVRTEVLALARAYISKHFPEVRLCLSYSSTEEIGDVCAMVFDADGWCPFGFTSGGIWTDYKGIKRATNDSSPKIRWVRSP